MGLATPGLRVPGAVALVGVAMLYVAGQKVSGVPVWTVLGFPFSVMLFVYSMMRSMVVTLKDGGVTWRGTFYSLNDLRKSVAVLR